MFIIIYIGSVLWINRRKQDVILSIAEARKQIDIAKKITRLDKRIANFKTYWPVVSMFINCKDRGEKVFQVFLLFSNLHVTGFLASVAVWVSRMREMKDSYTWGQLVLLGSICSNI